MPHAPISVVLVLAGAVLIVASSNIQAASLSPGGLSRVGGLSKIVLVQNKPKPETVKHKAKRIWKTFTGYKFDVNCPFTPHDLYGKRQEPRGRAREVPVPAPSL